eukprot:COSAG01_NODE_5780_length_4036_cov_27.009906_1_plen_38_part_00
MRLALLYLSAILLCTCQGGVFPIFYEMAVEVSGRSHI